MGCWHTITGPDNRDAKRQSPPSGPANSLEAGLHDTRNHPEPAEPLRLGLTFSTSCQRITAAGALQELLNYVISAAERLLGQFNGYYSGENLDFTFTDHTAITTDSNSDSHQVLRTT